MPKGRWESLGDFLQFRQSMSRRRQKLPHWRNVDKINRPARVPLYLHRQRQRIVALLEKWESQKVQRNGSWVNIFLVIKVFSRRPKLRQYRIAHFLGVAALDSEEFDLERERNLHLRQRNRNLQRTFTEHCQNGDNHHIRQFKWANGKNCAILRLCLPSGYRSHIKSLSWQ